MSVGNNFFYTKSLPCSLWFFDKGKAEAIRDKVLFIDARNYYTVVDRTLNEWSEWQLKNLNAIVWLHRGEVEKYRELQNTYYEWIRFMPLPFEDMGVSAELSEKMRKLDSISGLSEVHVLTIQERDACRERNKAAIAAAARKEKKALERSAADDEEYFKYCLDILDAAMWLTGKFGEGEYRDIPGLCKAATLAEIEEKNYSLTPGAYVGVAEQEDDGVDFSQRMQEIHRELLRLQTESNELMQTISRNMEGLGL